MTIEPQGWAVISVLAAAFAGLIGAWAVSIKQNASARTYSSKNESDSDKALKESQIDAQKTFIRIADRFTSGQDTMIKLVTDNINAINQNAAESRGMLLMMDNYSKALDGHGKILRDTAITVDGMNARVDNISKVTDTLQTDIEGSLTGQIGPLVIAIQGIGRQLDTLNTTLKAGDEASINLMNGLQSSFVSLESKLLQMLEPIALRTFREPTPLENAHAENGKTTGDNLHDA